MPSAYPPVRRGETSKALLTVKRACARVRRLETRVTSVSLAWCGPRRWRCWGNERKRSRAHGNSNGSLRFEEIFAPIKKSNVPSLKHSFSLADWRRGSLTAAERVVRSSVAWFHRESTPDDWRMVKHLLISDMAGQISPRVGGRRLAGPRKARTRGMFAAYQGGPFVEIFTPTVRPGANRELSGRVCQHQRARRVERARVRHSKEHPTVKSRGPGEGPADVSPRPVVPRASSFPSREPVRDG